MEVFVFDIFLFSQQKKHFYKFWKNLSIGFRATLNLWKNHVTLNPIDRVFWKFAEMFSLTIKQKYDMSKAFDSMHHDLMLSKLHSIGVSSGAWSWFGSYLSQRCQVVNIANSVSDPLPVTVGIPQGSTLGPVLFTLYVNDLLSIPRHRQAMGYVDNTKIFLGLPSSQISDAVTALNKDLSEIARWCCTNSLLNNPDKTKLLVIGVPQLTRSLPSIPPVKLLGKEIKPVTVAKDLGVIIDSSPSFNEHVTKTVSDCMHRLIRINRIR